jgi:sortase A
MSFFVEPRVYPRREFRLPGAWRRRLRGREWSISLERALFIVGALLLGWCGWTLAEAHAWQRYAGWSLERQRRGETASVTQYLASRVGFVKERPAPAPPAAPEAEPVPAPGDLVGRLEIPRLGLSAIVFEGDDDRTLKLGVGHIPGTALPGPRGNMALAAHRDSFFRPLHEIRRADEIELTTALRTYRYRVSDVSIVRPDDVAVLRDTARPSLTLVTCYPFWWVGNAPKRFVVHASRIESN